MPEEIEALRADNAALSKRVSDQNAQIERQEREKKFIQIAQEEAAEAKGSEAIVLVENAALKHELAAAQATVQALSADLRIVGAQAAAFKAIKDALGTA